MIFTKIGIIIGILITKLIVWGRGNLFLKFKGGAPNLTQ